jgi:hypothetical protein
MMGRMRAIARGIGWGIVLLLAMVAIGCAALWVRSYRWSDSISYHGRDGSWDIRVFINTDQLGCWLLSTRDERPLGNWEERGWDWEPGEKAIPAESWWNDWIDFPAVRHSGGAAGFHCFIADGRPNGDFVFPRVRAVGVPLWFVTLVTGLVPSLAVWRSLRRRRARRRRQSGFCERCGYDLRASPERCPECATVVER